MPAKIKVASPKPCERCGSMMQRKRFNGTLEDFTAFQRRRFCSLSCANKRGNWGKSSTAKHRAANKMKLAACEACGRPHEKLHVHHKNEDFTDNSPQNLETLCPSCHKRRHVSAKRRK